MMVEVLNYAQVKGVFRACKMAKKLHVNVARRVMGADRAHSTAAQTPR